MLSRKNFRALTLHDGDLKPCKGQKLQSFMHAELSLGI